MEEFFGDVYYDVQRSAGDPHSPALAAYLALLGLYNLVLAKTTNWMLERPYGVVGRYLRAVTADRSMASLTIITFNQDLVLENQLAMLPRQPRWCADHGYGPIALDFTGVHGKTNFLPRHSSDCDHSCEIQLLKLHGSLNWQTVTQSHAPKYADLFPSGHKKPALQCITTRTVYVNLVRRSKRRSYTYWPQIVPPIYEKGGLITARFGDLWSRAEEALAAADRLAFLGYSHPPADVHASNMMKRAIGRNSKLKRLDVINPDPQVVPRLADLTHSSAINWYRRLDSYTASLPRS